MLIIRFPLNVKTDPVDARERICRSYALGALATAQRCRWAAAVTHPFKLVLAIDLHVTRGVESVLRNP